MVPNFDIIQKQIIDYENALVFMNKHVTYQPRNIMVIML